MDWVAIILILMLGSNKYDVRHKAEQNLEVYSCLVNCDFFLKWGTHSDDPWTRDVCTNLLEDTSFCIFYKIGFPKFSKLPFTEDQFIDIDNYEAPRFNNWEGYRNNSVVADTVDVPDLILNIRHKLRLSRSDWFKMLLLAREKDAIKDSADWFIKHCTPLKYSPQYMYYQPYGGH